jgi:hypothetical protein
MLPNERAAFKPYPPDIIVDQTVQSIPNFEHVKHISCDDIDRNGLQYFSQLFDYWVIRSGRPLVIKGFQDLLDKDLFSSEWLQKNYGKKGKLSFS